MAMVTTFPVYDPWNVSTPAAEHIGEIRQYNQRIYALVRKVYERNQAAGKKGKELFWATGILRADPKRHTNFNLAMRIDKYEIFPRDVGAVEYAGSMGAAETLLGGEWRIASLDEEIACVKQDIAERDV